MHLIEKLRDLFHTHHEVVTDIEYWCYHCYAMLHCNVDINGTDWSKLTVICKRCKSKETIIHKVNGQVIRAD